MENEQKPGIKIHFMDSGSLETTWKDEKVRDKGFDLILKEMRKGRPFVLLDTIINPRHVTHINKIPEVEHTGGGKTTINIGGVEFK